LHLNFKDSAQGKPTLLDQADDRCQSIHLRPPSLAEFIDDSDKLMYSNDNGLAKVYQKVALHIVNNVNDLQSLHLALTSANLSNEARLRPNWDQYFMQLADLASHRSNCMKRRVGCVLVREKRVISTGYNGTPRGLQNCNEGGCKFYGECNDDRSYKQVHDATLRLVEVLHLIHACVFMQRKTPYSKQAEKESERDQFYIVTRKSQVTKQS
jgi:deoxycytidylate deaminase